MSVDPKTNRLAENVATALMHYLAWINRYETKDVTEVTASLTTDDYRMREFKFSISHPVGTEGRTLHEFNGTREQG